ncbi:MAG: gluconate 2-dehydrogenase subunit 3 family protein [Cyclobacteriaceae bacterium]|nr:gluconate 2-dehydrogenase subunit 3 family protein [Cyclobacteriaceae bacterium]UYN88547.1 MAG: gluconate 2-dehydrogenase subunit 3 family protein [Cyclobacteriaceae bacterium]
MGILKGCQAKPGIDWTPEFFTADQAFVVTAVAEIIIPKTDTPGAKEAGVPAFIEEMVYKAYKQADREKFIAALDEFTNFSGFLKLGSEKQKEYVLEAHQKAIEEKPEQRPFVMMMKELTMLGFFSSKPGATEVLRYEAVPGYYNGCMPLSEVGKTWAT